MMSDYEWISTIKINHMHISFNDHVSNYISAKEHIETYAPEWFENDPPEEVERMKETDSIWTVQIYPHTPIGFYSFNRSTLSSAIAAARECFKDEKL